MSAAKPRQKPSLVFLSPEMVKHRSLLALRRRQLQQFCKHSSSFLGGYEKRKESILDRSEVARKKSGDNENEGKRLPWLGVGFQKSKGQELGLYKEARQRWKKALMVKTDSKDVQVSISLESSSRTLIPSAAPVLPPVTSVLLPEPEHSVPELLPQSHPHPAIKTVLLGEHIPKDHSGARFDYNAFVEGLKRRKSPVEEHSEPRGVVTVNVSYLDISHPCAIPVLQSADPELPKKAVPRKPIHRPTPPNGSIPLSTFTLGVTSAPRSKSAFTMSRILKHSEKSPIKRKSEAPSILPPHQPTIIEEDDYPKPEPLTQQNSDPQFELRLRHCLPYRIPVEFNLFRRVKKLSQAKLRCLL